MPPSRRKSITHATEIVQGVARGELFGLKQIVLGDVKVALGALDAVFAELDFGRFILHMSLLRVPMVSMSYG